VRLIHTLTRQFHDFIGSNVPAYAILSHTWEDEEVTYQDYVAGDCQHMGGYYKIDMTCRLAREDGIPFAWIDTCCIEKSRSAELSEAINLMNRWYQMCATYICQT
jgi:hypothetical protein